MSLELFCPPTWGRISVSSLGPWVCWRAGDCSRTGTSKSWVPSWVLTTSHFAHLQQNLTAKMTYSVLKREPRMWGGSTCQLCFTRHSREDCMQREGWASESRDPQKESCWARLHRERGQLCLSWPGPSIALPFWLWLRQKQSSSNIT